MSGYLGLWHYWATIALSMLGLYTLIAKNNLVKKMMGLSIFQVSVIMLYVSMAKVTGGTAPILRTDIENPVYSNPLPHVLMLTAIVVGVATTAVSLSLIVCIREEYGTSEDDEIRAIDREAM